MFSKIGIDNQNTEGTYDFSHIQQDNAKAIEEEVAAEEGKINFKKSFLKNEIAEEAEGTEESPAVESESSDDEKPRK